MKNYLFILLILSIFGACKSGNDDKNVTNDSTKVAVLDTAIEIQPSTTFYNIDAKTGNALVLADTIIYDAVVKNPNPENVWTKECLKRLNNKALVNVIFQAVYKKRLIPYNYQTETPMTLDEIKALEKEFPRKRIGKVQFVEQWYFDEATLQFGKRIIAITFGYELDPVDGIIDKYKAAFKVYLTDSLKNNPNVYKTINQ